MKTLRDLTGVCSARVRAVSESLRETHDHRSLQASSSVAWAYPSDARASESVAVAMQVVSSRAAMSQPGTMSVLHNRHRTPSPSIYCRSSRARRRVWLPAIGFRFPKQRNRVCNCLLAGSLLLRQAVLRLCHPRGAGVHPEFLILWGWANCLHF